MTSLLTRFLALVLLAGCPLAVAQATLLRLPGQTQPVAPGTRCAAPIPELALTPPMAQVLHLQYLSNGHIEVAGAVVLLQESEVPRARAFAQAVVTRALLARPSLSEVDVSVYNKAGYGGFGGPLPILTLSAPRPRLADVARWAAGGHYEQGLGSAGQRATDAARQRKHRGQGARADHQFLWQRGRDPSERQKARGQPS